MNENPEKQVINIPKQVDLDSAAKSVKNTGSLNLHPKTYEDIRRSSGQDGINAVFDLVQTLKAILKIK
ncbi:hypothetical protein A2954_02495 [Candidatus Roizmanbacteria bacterium RIFCSPLOWO2_01_FULL_37_12]|uniref:Uncharacterized protein n=1 Tax=Candidatus Roizmanbacteria bacterium RIFCSPLOWO2_01_FULL_37_12 TaxID=1802056 RepID=A0A1F7IEV8_9BACT|nr:MAG: hypothetical protein A3D76_00065 [Candidatus Roizmanbacteria bacterium RIFCSPHIGHO2_02_FULL_37_9b]OGK41895.1 MAG: hypothetical protein A2954_02495 [Candidatus Roizmanbacteria bacterium RIFCSPLOWO2_01_FULL_37_12]